MHPYEQLILTRFQSGIRSWDMVKYPDIYAASCLYSTFWTADEDGDEVIVEGAVALSFNTSSFFQSRIRDASDESEAKWNFAFWKQEITAQVPRLLDAEYGAIPDKEELRLRDAWCAAQNILPVETDANGNPVYNGELEEATVMACARIVKYVHASGLLREVIGKQIPFLIHSLTYDEIGIAATKDANPPHLITEFLEEFG